MDWSGPKRAFHPNPGRERINLMEVAKDFLGAVEFAADVRGETSRRARSCRLADHPERGQTSQYKRVSRYQSRRAARSPRHLRHIVRHGEAHAAKGLTAFGTSLTRNRYF